MLWTIPVATACAPVPSAAATTSWFGVGATSMKKSAELSALKFACGCPFTKGTAVVSSTALPAPDALTVTIASDPCMKAFAPTVTSVRCTRTWLSSPDTRIASAAPGSTCVGVTPGYGGIVAALPHCPAAPPPPHHWLPAQVPHEPPQPSSPHVAPPQTGTHFAASPAGPSGCASWAASPPSLAAPSPASELVLPPSGVPPPPPSSSVAESVPPSGPAPFDPSADETGPPSSAPDEASGPPVEPAPPLLPQALKTRSSGDAERKAQRKRVVGVSE